MSVEAMAVVVAYVQPFQLDAVVDGVRKTPGFRGITVTEARGIGSGGIPESGGTEARDVEPLEKRSRLELFCRAADASRILQAIRETAHTGHRGDGKAFVLDVAWAVGIRTGAVGAEAL